MKFRLPPSFAAVAAALVLAVVGQAADADERVAAAFVLALGRGPTPAELTQWTDASGVTVAALVTRLQTQLAADPAAAGMIAKKAFTDAFGRAPKGDEAVGTGTYAELMRTHVSRLSAQPEEYAAMLGRAYQLVISREVYPEEIEYWRKQDPLPYALVVACLEDWARRNQPGLMVTGGTATASVNSQYLTTIRLSPAIAGEARAVAGLDPLGATAAPTIATRRIIAVGAGKLVSSGGIHFVAAGAADLVP